MKPRIDGSEFGSITIAGETLDHDVLIRPDGKVKKRKKKLSKEVYGTSHVISLAELNTSSRKRPAAHYWRRAGRHGETLGGS